jgi:hypothetical protein
MFGINRGIKSIMAPVAGKRNCSGCSAATSTTALNYTSWVCRYASFVQTRKKLKNFRYLCKSHTREFVKLTANSNPSTASFQIKLRYQSESFGHLPD